MAQSACQALDINGIAGGRDLAEQNTIKMEEVGGAGTPLINFGGSLAQYLLKAASNFGYLLPPWVGPDEMATKY